MRSRARERDEPRDVVAPTAGKQRATSRDAGVARRAARASTRGLRRELPGERVLAPAADDQTAPAPATRRAASRPEARRFGSLRDPAAATLQCRKCARREDHGDAEPVGGRDHLVVARGAAGLHERRGAGGDRLLEAVGEREEGVAREHRAAQRDADRARAFARAWWTASTREVCAAAERERAVGAREHDGVRLDVLHDAPGEARARAARRRWACAASRRGAAATSSSARSGSCTSRPPNDAPQVELGASGTRSGWKRSRRRFFFFASSASASASKPGAISTSVKISSTARASARSKAPARRR